MKLPEITLAKQKQICVLKRLQPLSTSLLKEISWSFQFICSRYNWIRKS